MKTYEFRVYKDKAGEYRWRLMARNGRIIADSGEGYRTRETAWRAVKRIQDGAAAAGRVDVR